MRSTFPIPAALRRLLATGSVSFYYQGADGIEVEVPVPADYATTDYFIGADPATGLPAWLEVVGGGGSTYTADETTLHLSAFQFSIKAGGVGTTELANDGVTNAKLANMATATMKGRKTAGTGDPEDLSAADARTNMGLGTAAVLDSDTDNTLAANSDLKLATQKAVKAFVENLLAGRAWKNFVRAATTVAGTLASSFENGDTIDGVVLATGDRILIKNQAAPAENGIYTVNASGAPTRATDADSSAELVNAAVFVSEGTTNADTQWVCTTNAPITVGTTGLTFVQFGTGTVYLADGTTLQLTGTTFSIKAGGVGTTELAARGVTFPKLPSITDERLLGRSAGSAGDMMEIVPGTGLSLVAGVLTVVGAVSGGSGILGFAYTSRASNTILTAADSGRVIHATAAFTQTFDPAATMGAGVFFVIHNATTDGTSIVELDPDGTEEIDGLGAGVSLKMYSGEARLVMCTGATLKTLLLQGGFARFVTPGANTFYLPPGARQVMPDVIGGGGSGGGGRGGGVSTTRGGGGGAGGGARHRAILDASLLGSPGAAITCTVAAGTTGGSGGTNADGSPGTVGNNSTFGSFMTGYGGGRGLGGTTSGTAMSGGGGGGAGAVGGTGVSGTSSQGGGNSGIAYFTTQAMSGMGLVGENGAQTAAQAGAEWGGAAGGSVPGGGGTFSGNNGGSSLYGGAGGGGGGGVGNQNPGNQTAAGSGGSVGVMGNGGGGTLGAAGGASPGGDGADGDLRVCGQGGGGGGGKNSGTGAAAGKGGAPGGGGGGGGGGTSTGGAGGDGARGEIRVWYW